MPGNSRVMNNISVRIPTINRLPGNNPSGLIRRYSPSKNRRVTVHKIVKPAVIRNYSINGDPGLTLPKLLIAPELSWPTFNPYTKMPAQFINEFARDRDIYLEGSTEQKAEQLWNYERLDSEWIKSVLQFNDVQCTIYLPLAKYILYGAINGIDYSHITMGFNDNTKFYTRLSLIMKKSCHTHRSNITFINEVSVKVIDEYLLHNTQFKEDDIQIIPELHKRQMLRTNNVVDLNNIHINGISFPEIRRRYTMLKDFKYPEVLVNLYGSVKDAAKSSAHMIEPLILAINEDTVDQIITNIGMIVPLSAENKLKYLLDNIVEYRDIFTRIIKRIRSLKQLEKSGTASKIKYFNQLTDNEILSTTNAYLPYTSRLDLVKKAASCIAYKGKSKERNNITTDQFFTPIARKKEYILNHETIMGTDVQDLDTFMVAYGTATGYRLYEVDDLYGAFHVDEDDGTFDFRHPEDITQSFDQTSINRLVDLLKAYPQNDELDRLQERIQQGVAIMEEMIEEDEVVCKRLAQLDRHERETMKTLLIHIFEMGMYMRRWKGPGHPYPLIEEDTIIRGFDPEGLVIDTYSSINHIADNLSPTMNQFYNELPLVRYIKGKIKVSNLSTRPYITKVFSGKECIRMASIYLVSSGYHYLKVHFSHGIPGFDKQQIESIY